MGVVEPQTVERVSPQAGAPATVDLWAVIAAFGAYFCMYMFRKPYTAASFETMSAFGMAYKPLAIISQVLGYTISKFIGIKVVSEAKAHTRVATFFALIFVAEIALLLFAVTPSPYNLIWLFMNGLPLGMVFGLVLAYLEGRVRTEALTACLCASFVLADGVAKSSGTWIMNQGVTESWMPALTGLMFVPGILIFGWMLSRIPGQTAYDIALRSEREPMDREARRAFFRKFAVGLTLIVAIYSLVGVLRGIRGDFAREIWEGLNVKIDPALFSQSELIVAFSVLFVISLLILIKDNRRAFHFGLGLAGAGFLVVIGSLIGLTAGVLSPFAFMVLIGFGLYLPYIAVHATVFERLIAYTRERGTIGYLMYVADAASYAALVGVLFFKNLGDASPNAIMPFFMTLAWIVGVLCLLMLIPTSIFFNAKGKQA